MKLELTQEFYFEAAHTLARDYETASSVRIHGHTYHAAITVRGERNVATGMIIDLAALRAHIEAIRNMLDHRLLDDVKGIGPPTIENLAIFIAGHILTLEPRASAVQVTRKASGDSCLVEL